MAFDPSNLWFIISLITYALSLNRVVYGAPQVPCCFAFGDSLSDNGNNNNLKTTAKANFPPYGVDFHDGPTGRFTNGRNFADVIVELLGFTSYPPPYASAKGKNVFMGVNYASAGSGILPETGKNLGEHFGFDAQLIHHNDTVSRINNALKGKNGESTSHLNKCIYLVGIGSNDYINNYLMPQYYPTNRLYKQDQFAAYLIKTYSDQLTKLYNYGARKVALFGLGNIGCTPAIIAMAPKAQSPSGCVDQANAAIKEFNDRLKPLVDSLNNKLKGAKFVYVNTTHITAGGPAALGITTPVPCCKISATTGMCIEKQTPCKERGTHAYFDAFHPTEKAIMPTATRAYKSTSPLDVYPMDILHLSQLPS